MKNLLYITVFAISIAVSLASCNREPSAPPEPVVDYITIEQLRKMHQSGAIDTIKTNLYIQGVITLTPELGNVPDMIAYIQDSTAAICLVVDDTDNTLAMDSEVKILCNGVAFEEYNGLLQFGANGTLTIASNIKVISLSASIEPVTTTIDMLLTGKYEGMYVNVPGVQFSSTGTFSGNKTLTDCLSEISVYTRPAATFSATTIPAGNGSLKGVSSVFTSQQILLRDPSELDMSGTRCSESEAEYLYQDFSTLVKNADVSTLTGWRTYSQAGTKTWYGNENTSNKWVQATAYGSGQASVITWMITPLLDFTSAVNPYLIFKSLNGYDNGATLELFVSTDYSGSVTPWTSTWNKLSFTPAPSNPSGFSGLSFVSSGLIDLSAYKGEPVYIAWVYTGATDKTTTWEIDNIRVGER